MTEHTMLLAPPDFVQPADGLPLNGMKFAVNDLYPAVQGEGVHTGVPMAILRLHGCGVGCPFCDTKETWAFVEPESESVDAALGVNAHYIWLSPSQIAYELHQRVPSFRWVMVTGGEPARYPLRFLAPAIHDVGMKMALETSGTELGHLDASIDWITVSPKIDMPGGKVVRPEALAVADEIKFVVGRSRDIDVLDRLLVSLEGTLKPSCQICLQPMSQSKRATDLCIETVQARGWRLSIQLHRYLGLK